MNYTSTRFYAALVLPFLAIGAASAQSIGTTFEEIEAAAKQEGNLVIYATIATTEMQKHIEQFEAAYPEIHVEAIRMTSSQLFSRFTGEYEAGVVQADFLASGATTLYEESPELFLELSTDAVPNLALSNVPAKNDHYAIYQFNAHSVIYNTDLVSAEDLEQHLATWEGLADPRWEGRIAFGDPAASINHVSFAMTLRDTYGDDFIGRLADNNFAIVGSVGAAAQQVAAGAYEILIPTIAEQATSLIETGAPIALYLPDGFVHAPLQGMAVPKDASNPNAALLFMNWKLSEEGQGLNCEGGGLTVYAFDDPRCTTQPPEDFVQGRTRVSDEESAEMLTLLGIQP